MGSLYAFGYVAGSLAAPLPSADPPADSRTDPAAISWIVVRIIAGLLLSTIAFFLALVFGLPWLTGPMLILGLALGKHRRRALALLRPPAAFRPGTAIAALLGAVMLSPIVISGARMTPGEFAPVFFNVDSAYSLEQVQSLTKTRTYPPESLSNAGGRRSYHYATYGMAALVARASGLPPHQAIFGIVLPLVAAGVLAAAFIAARMIAPALPVVFTVPLLLIPVPSFWYPFWADLGPVVYPVVSGEAPLAAVAPILRDREIWGVASIVAPNVGAHFLVLATLGTAAAAPFIGWRLPILLAGAGVLIKVPAGVAVVGGFACAAAWQALRARSLRPFVPAAAALGLFAIVFATFWVVPGRPPEFAVELYPLFHLQRMQERERFAGVAADLLWLFLPALIVALARVRERATTAVPLLLFGLAPLVIVNVTRAVDARPGGGGATDDWVQILFSVPMLLRAFTISLANARWRGLPVALRLAFLAALALSLAPSVYVAFDYARVLLRDPLEGHEFVDNRRIAAALRAIPRQGTLIVTNDLRYPAQRFSRENRQMQVPALFGHQAFAVNYAYEVFSFSRSRRDLQELLQSTEWSDAITAAAREHGWTHLLIHKPYPHPRPIPLERIFEDDAYAVYRFSPG